MQAGKGALPVKADLRQLRANCRDVPEHHATVGETGQVPLIVPLLVLKQWLPPLSPATSCRRLRTRKKRGHAQRCPYKPLSIRRWRRKECECWDGPRRSARGNNCRVA